MDDKACCSVAISISAPGKAVELHAGIFALVAAAQVVPIDSATDDDPSDASGADADREGFDGFNQNESGCAAGTVTRHRSQRAFVHHRAWSCAHGNVSYSEFTPQS
jgi:hypothetical protein